MNGAILWAMNSTYDELFAAAVANEWCDCWASMNGRVSDWLAGWDGDAEKMGRLEWDCIRNGCDSFVCQNASCTRKTDLYGRPIDLVTKFAEWFLTDASASADDRRLLELARAGSGKYNESVHRTVLDMNEHRRRLAGSCASKSGDHCHPAHSLLELEDGRRVRIDEISVGQRIRTPSGFEPVAGFLHADASVRPSYHVFATDGGASVAISDNHWLLVDGVEADPATVQLGQMLRTPNGWQRVTAISKEVYAGAYHLVTPSGLYYVDDVAASTYVAYIPHAAWKIFGDGYITLRYRLGVPLMPEGQTPITILWSLDVLRAMGFSHDTALTYAWPFIAGSTMATELICAVTTAAAKLVAPISGGAVSVAAALVAAPLVSQRLVAVTSRAK